MKAFVDERDAELVARAKANAKKLNQMHKEVADGLLASPTELSGEGSRLLLYRLYVNPAYGIEQKVTAFIRKFADVPKGTSVSTHGRDAAELLLKAVIAAPLEEIAKRLVEYAMAALGDSSPYDEAEYNAESYGPVRLWLAETFAVDKEMVDGGRGLYPKPKEKPKAEPQPGDVPDDAGVDDLVAEGIVPAEEAEYARGNGGE